MPLSEENLFFSNVLIDKQVRLLEEKHLRIFYFSCALYNANEIV